jgi:hypothetical protein
VADALPRFLAEVVDTFVTAPKQREVANPAAAKPPSSLDAPLTEAEENLVYETVAQGYGILEAAYRIAEARGTPFALQGLTASDVLDPRALAAFEDSQGETPEFRLLMAAREVEERIHIEFDGFPDYVQNAFSGNAQLNKVTPSQRIVTGLTSYAYIHSRLWKAGIPNPTGLFSQMKRATLLGRDIANGVHPVVIDRLGELASQEPVDELHAQMAPEIKELIGFQPRRIAGKEALSNHVYGLAIDINASWSPHIKSPATIEIIKRHTDPPTDFARPFLEPGQSIDEIDRTLKRASNQIRKWLAVALRKQTQLASITAAAETRKNGAESKLWNAQTDADRAAAQSELSQAEQELDRAHSEENASEDAVEVNELIKEWGRATLENWERVGLFTIPIKLAKELTRRGFGWGAEWSTHKDVMHFELDPRLVEAGDYPPVSDEEAAA